MSYVRKAFRQVLSDQEQALKEERTRYSAKLVEMMERVRTDSLKTKIRRAR